MDKQKLTLLLSFVCLLATLVSCKSEPKEKEMAAYLLVYFTDPTHSLFMALSPDGYTFTDVNNGQPVIGGEAWVSDPSHKRGSPEAGRTLGFENGVLI